MLEGTEIRLDPDNLEAGVKELHFAMMDGENQIKEQYIAHIMTRLSDLLTENQINALDIVITENGVEVMDTVGHEGLAAVFYDDIQGIADEAQNEMVKNLGELF